MTEQDSLPTLLAELAALAVAYVLMQRYARRFGDYLRRRYVEGAEGRPTERGVYLGGLALMLFGLAASYYAIYMPYHAVQIHAPEITYSPELAVLSILLFVGGAALIAHNGWYVAHYQKLGALKLTRPWVIGIAVIGGMMFLGVQEYFTSHGYQSSLSPLPDHATATEHGAD